MNLRMKAKYYCARRVDFSKKQRLVVLEGCQLYEERLKLNRLLEQGTDSEYVEAMKVFKKHANQEKRKQAPVCLSMRLKHGDMVVMHGSETQLYYEVHLPSLIPGT